MSVRSWLRQLFRPAPIVPVFGAAIKSINGMSELIGHQRPDLVTEFEAIRHEPCGSMRPWLDRNFPIDGGWGTRSVSDGAADLSAYFEGRR